MPSIFIKLKLMSRKDQLSINYNKSHRFRFSDNINLTKFCKRT